MNRKWRVQIYRHLNLLGWLLALESRAKGISGSEDQNVNPIRKKTYEITKNGYWKCNIASSDVKVHGMAIGNTVVELNISQIIIKTH